MKDLFSRTLSTLVALSLCAPAVAAPTFQERVTYIPSLTPAERTAIHAKVDALSGNVGDAVAGDGTYDPLTLVGAMLDGATYDSISRGGTAATAYPFPVSNTAANQNEYDRKVAKLAWVVKRPRSLGFPVVVQRQPDKYVYAEIGDPDAPEMVMALSHLDSPTASVTAAQLARWGADPFGTLGHPGAYHSPYIKDGWVYGAGMQDDSGPTLATLLAAKALLEAGLPHRPTHPHRHGHLRRRRSRHALDGEHRHLPVDPVQLEPELLRQLGLQEPQPRGDADRGLHLRLAVPGHRRQLRSGDPVGVDELVRGQPARPSG